MLLYATIFPCVSFADSNSPRGAWRIFCDRIFDIGKLPRTAWKIQPSASARELERQINSLLYERLALSADKKGLMRLATKGHVVRKPEDVFKDPVVMEFIGLPESPRLVESTLERALIDNLQSFLLEYYRPILTGRI